VSSVNGSGVAVFAAAVDVGADVGNGVGNDATEVGMMISPLQALNSNDMAPTKIRNAAEKRGVFCIMNLIVFVIRMHRVLLKFYYTSGCRQATLLQLKSVAYLPD
jgi:hypothetical protein